MSAATMAPELEPRSHISTASQGPRRPGYLSETELAARWSRHPNTLQSWRNRPSPDRRAVPYEMFGIYAYYAIADVVRVEVDPLAAYVRPVAQRETPLPSLFTTDPRERLLESVAMMAQAEWLTPAELEYLLTLKWLHVPYDPQHACLEERAQFQAACGRTWEPREPQALSEMEAQLDANAGDTPAQPELPLEGLPVAEHLTLEDPEDAAPDRFSEDVTNRMASLADILASTKLSTPGYTTGYMRLAPAMHDFTIVAGYAIARDERRNTWYAPVLGGNLNALDWQLVTPLPTPKPIVVPAAGAQP